jgi:hypothetical protein
MSFDPKKYPKRTGLKHWHPITEGARRCLVCNDIAYMNQEIERLRAALNYIAYYGQGDYGKVVKMAEDALRGTEEPRTS